MICTEFVWKQSYPVEISTVPADIGTGDLPANYKSNIQLIPPASQQAVFVAANLQTGSLKIWNFHSDDSVGSMLLEYDAM
jgi:hypothetical protein